MLGSDYSDAALGTDGVRVDVLIEASTALIKSALKNSGYPAPATQDPTTVDELVKLGVFACLREMLASVPDAQIPLPEGWQTSPQKMVLRMIIEGDFPIPSVDPSTAGGVGGAVFTDPLISTNYERKTTKTELGGY
jgi:hypothetical protein